MFSYLKLRYLRALISTALPPTSTEEGEGEAGIGAPFRSSHSLPPDLLADISDLQMFSGDRWNTTVTCRTYIHLCSLSIIV